MRDIIRKTSNRHSVLVATTAINVLSLAMPIVILQVYDRVIPHAAVGTLAIFVIALGGVLLLDFLFTLGRAYITGWSAARLQHVLGTLTIDRMMGSDLAEVDRIAPGVQLQRLRAVEVVKNFYSGQAVLVLADLPFIALFLGLIALIGGELALIPAAILALTALVALHSGQRLKNAINNRSLMDDRRHNFIIEVLSKIQTVKALGLETLLVRRYERLQGSSAEHTYWVTYFSSMARSIGGAFSQLTMIGVVAYGSTRVVEGALSIGALAACTFLAGRSAQPMLRGFGLWTQFQGIKLGREQVDTSLALPQERDGRAPAIGPLSGRMELSRVSFGYGDDPKGLLSDIDLVLRPGEAVGITGANGCGKSTLILLVSGLLAPTGGRVLLDGYQPGNVEPWSVRSQICFIPQSGALFNGTILENITMFQGESHIEDALRHAESLGLNEVVARLPNGFDTVVGDGSNDGLPGGIKQRIAICRALTLVKEPKLILFDEANSSLDMASDQLLKNTLEKYRGRSTMLLISHRPSVLRLADRTYVLRAGSLHATGDDAHAAQQRLARELAK